MKTLITILLAFVYISVNAQTFHATVGEGAMYMTDTTKVGDAFGRDHNITIHNFHPGAWFDAEYQGQKVFVRAIYIDKTDEFREYFHKLVIQPMLDSLNKKNPNLFAEYKKSIIKKYGVKYGNDILHGIIRIGQPKKVVIEILGEPDDINRTVTKTTINEQYVYKIEGQVKSKLYYFTNGILTGLQD